VVNANVQSDVLITNGNGTLNIPANLLNTTGHQQGSKLWFY
jgi:hypothetical protein